MITTGAVFIPLHTLIRGPPRDTHRIATLPGPRAVDPRSVGSQAVSRRLISASNGRPRRTEWWWH